MDWISDAISDIGDAISDAWEWVKEKASDVWESDLGKIAVIAAAVYFGGVALTGNWGWIGSAFEGGAAAEVAAHGAGELAVATPGAAAAGGETALAATEVASLGGMEAGALAGTEAAAAGGVEAGSAAFLEPVSAATPELTLAGAGSSVVPTGVPPVAETGVLDAMGAWAAENPMMAYGGMMVAGQGVSGYMQGEQMKELEEQRLAEEAAARDRQNVWGVNYGTGEQTVMDAGGALKDLNRSYFDASQAIAKTNPYLTAGERAEAGALDEMTSLARPASQYDHRTTVNS